MWYSVPHTQCMPSMVLIVSLYFRAAQQRLQSGVIISLQNPLSGVGQVQQLQECCCLEKALAAWGSTGRMNSRCFFPGKTRPPQKWERAKENTCQSAIVFKQMTGNKAGICLDCEQEWVETPRKALVPLPGCPQHNPACYTWSTQPKDRVILSRCMWEEIRKGKFCSWSLSNSTKQTFFFLCFWLESRDCFFFRSEHHLLYMQKKQPEAPTWMQIWIFPLTPPEITWHFISSHHDW